MVALFRFGRVKRPPKTGCSAAQHKQCGNQCQCCHEINTNSCHDTTHLPTKFSRTLLFPALWLPTTAICGRSRDNGTPIDEKASCSLLTMGMRNSIPTFPDILRYLMWLCHYAIFNPSEYGGCIIYARA